MAYRNKVYVSMDADNDLHYYYLMKAWKQNDNTEFNFYDAHEINQCHLVNQFQIKIQWFSFRESHCFFSSKT